jgi:isopentenyl phosphate kinase
MREAILVKWGGSLITDKRRPATARPEVIARLAGELAGWLTEGRSRVDESPVVILGHGSGSFGHAAAARAGLNRGPLSPTQLAGVAETQAAARELHRLVVGALAEAGAPPYSIAPGSAAVADAGRLVELEAEPLALALDSGLLPVVFGDVVPDRTWGFSIASTEAVFTALAERLPAQGFRVVRAIWLGKTAGLYDAEGQTVPEVTPETAPTHRTTAHGAAGTDVTGGMLHRLDTAIALAAAGVESLLANGTVPGLLPQALSGHPVLGTRVPATR